MATETIKTPVQSAAPVNGKATPIVGTAPAPAPRTTDAPRMADADAARRLSALIVEWFAREPVGARAQDKTVATSFGGPAIAGYLKALGAHLKAQYGRLCELERIGASNPRANIGLTHPDGGNWPDGRKVREMNGTALAQCIRRDDVGRKAAQVYARANRID